MPVSIMMLSPRLFGIPCWSIPVFAGFTWLATLSSMLFLWFWEGFRQYPEMGPIQRYAYISNVGASHLGKPVFQAGSFITVLTFGVAFGIERWLRRIGRLLHHDSSMEVLLSRLATIFSVLGASGLMGLTIFDVRRDPQIHKPLIVLFILGYLLAAMAICVEKSLLHAAHPHNPIILRSFRIKLIFILIETGLSLIFGYTFALEIWTPSIFLEWTIAFFFTLYMWSFSIDFLDVPTLATAVALGEEGLADHELVKAAEKEELESRLSLANGGDARGRGEKGWRLPKRSGGTRGLWWSRKRFRGYNVRLK